MPQNPNRAKDKLNPKADEKPPAAANLLNIVQQEPRGWRGSRLAAQRGLLSVISFAPAITMPAIAKPQT